MKSKRLPGWAAIAAAVWISNTGCVTVGKEFDTTHVNDVRMGQPRGEILNWFGEPAVGNKLSLVDSPHGCVKRYRYNFASASQAAVLWIDFDTQDQVCNTVYSRG